MQVYRGHLDQLPPIPEAVSLTIGNFDGVHRGHQYLIGQLIQQSQARGAAPAVLCFDPHPDLVFSTTKFQLLTTTEEKIRLLAELGIQYLVLQTFDPNFSKVSAKDFLRQYLGRFFNLSSLLIGYDFHFGHKGEGSFSLIQELFQSSSCQVEQAKPFSDQGEPLSSSVIRAWLEEGKVEQASKVLGRPYSLEGEVVSGQKLGRQLGFPTANIGSLETLIPGRGVYSCEAKIHDQTYPAVVNIGERPTVNGQDLTVEAHLLGFQGDLYGKRLKVQFFKKIRDERKFENLDKLKEQIAKDIQVAAGVNKNG